MIMDVMDDSKKLNFDLKISHKELLENLDFDKEIFEEVKIPRLVHWDIWDGNIFVKNNKISGIIDLN
jgi:Ser/Thr protein kinase RdoA (MazF antagonist)